MIENTGATGRIAAVVEKTLEKSEERKRRSLSRTLFLLVLLLLVPEAGSRVLDWRHSIEEQARTKSPYEVRYETASGAPIDEASAGGLLRLRHDPMLGYALVPSSTAEVVGPDGRKTSVRVNVRGLRGRDVADEKPAGTVRVLVIGGSAAFGTGATQDETTLPGHLERALATLAPAGRTVEVVNAGMPGFDSTQELVLLATRALDAKPDVVVIYDGWNDFARSFLTAPDAELTHPLTREVDDIVAERSQHYRGLLRASSLYRRLSVKRHAWREEAARVDATGGLLRYFGDRAEFPDRPEFVVRYRHSLERMAALARGVGAQVILATQPELVQRAEPLPDLDKRLRDTLPEAYVTVSRMGYARYQTAASAVARLQGATIVDCRAAFDGSPDAVFISPVHLTDRGNELVAAKLAPVVARLLFAAPEKG